MLLGGFLHVLPGLNHVGMRQLRVVGGFLKRPRQVLFGGFPVFPRGLFEMFSYFLVMTGCFL